MRALIAIQSIPGHEHAEQAMMDTWLRELPSCFAFQFFHPKTYETHFSSIQDACRAAVSMSFDYILCCDRDTYCRPERFLPSRFDHHDYTGYPLEYGSQYYASGGAGYWMSRKAFILVAECKQQPVYHADMSVGCILADGGIRLWPDPRYQIFRVPIEPHNTFISMHLSQGQGNYKPEWMREVHEEFRKL